MQGNECAKRDSSASAATFPGRPYCRKLPLAKNRRLGPTDATIAAGMAALAELLGESREMKAIRATIDQLLARSTRGQRLPSILIEGETGTGKGLVARALHRRGPRRDGPFVDVNCAAIPETLLEAEMFGFERGAFSEARQAKPGLFEAADRGTIFLDEIGLLAEPLQGKLLKAIEERSIRRLGSTRSRSVDVWIISASNEDLVTAMRQRRFREDLYHRLAVLTLRLPPLRERGDDIVLLAEHFLAQACADYKLAGKTLAADAPASLLGYPWPGNVRELANVMERAALLSESSVITARMLALPTPPSEISAPTAERALRAELGEVERERLQEALELTGWNLSRAAARLGIPRNTLRYRMEKHGLPSTHPARQVQSARRRETIAPPEPARDDELRWEPRRLTLVRAVIEPSADPLVTLPSTRAVDALVEKLEMFGGRLEEVDPKSLVAVFGLEPTEGATAAAAHAAVALVRAARVARDDGDHWTVRVAIHAGQFLVARGRNGPEIAGDARREAWPILDALVERAEPDGIVASDAARPFLTRGFELTALETVGSAGAAFKVVAREWLTERVDRRAAAFVGRQHSLELLARSLISALNGQGHAVGIVGEAGIGKSRLVAEFRRRLGSEPLAYREGACVSYGSAIPYLPVLDVLRQHCGIGEKDSAEEIRDKVDRSLAAVDVDRASALYVQHLLGLREGAEALATITPEAIKLRTLEALRQMILNASRRRPLVIVIEDLHWIDPTSEELLGSLVESVPSAPILFVATYRPGYRPPWLDRSYATQIALPPLSHDDSLAIVQSVLQHDVPETLSRVILDKADGNPFFLEELCRVVDDRPDGEALSTVPDTIEDVLLARIHRLADGPRRLLQTAAVGGREVSVRLLEAMWDRPEPIESMLSALTSLEFLYPGIRAGESIYAFKHALIQEVAYSTLSVAERGLMHGAAGRALERFYEGRLQEVYDRLAYHYARTDEPDRAIEYLRRFAEKSARAYAHDEAITALTEAQNHVERLPSEVRDRTILELVLQRSLSLLPLGRLYEIHSMLQDQRDRLERLENPALAARYYFLLARSSMLVDYRRVADNARRAIAEAERCGDMTTIGAAYGVMARAYLLSGQAARGIECGQRAVALLDKTVDQSSLALTYWALGLCHSQTGAFQDGMTAERRALAIAEAIGDQAAEVSATWALGIIQTAMGEWDDGVAICHRAVQRARNVLYQAIATGFLGFAYLERGDAALAIAALDEAITFYQQSGLKTFESWLTVFLAEAHRVEGRLDRAEALATRALEIATETNFPVAVGWAHQSLGRIAWARRDRETATARLTEALATFDAIHSRYEIARTHVDLAHVARTQDDREAASRHLREAHGLFTTLGVPRYRERVERLAAEWGTPLTSDGT
jgi:DNA-binding NtrC family response regulator/tetratricopeptide (TPR) repeat protein